MKYQSIIQARGSVPFPQFMAEKVYMKEFLKKDGLPVELKRWQPTVDAMLDGVDTDGPIFLMIDEGHVKAGQAHRRRGLHIDGYWNPGLSTHGAGGWGPSPSRHGPSKPSHVGRSPFHSSGSDSWEKADFTSPEAIILATSVAATVGYIGEFEGPIRDGGDCSHIDLRNLDKVNFESHRAYIGNVTGLHETLPVQEDCYRQVVRLNTSGWSI